MSAEPGWYPDDEDPSLLWEWDGTQWTGQAQPTPAVIGDDVEAESPARSVPTSTGAADAQAPRFTPRALVIAGGALLVTVVLAISGVVVSKQIEEKNNAKIAAVQAYVGWEQRHTNTLSGLQLVIDTASVDLTSTSADEVTDPSLLTTLTAEVEAGKTRLAEETFFDLDTEASSTETVLRATDQLKRSQIGLQDTKESLDGARTAVEKSRDAKTAQNAAEAARIAAEKKAADTAAAKANAQTITYENLFRAGQSVVGTYYRFEGKIIQDAGDGIYRVNMTRDPGYSIVFWEDTILLGVAGNTSQRLLEDDIITFIAASGGIEDYTTVFNATVSVPLVLAEAADVAVTGRAD